MANTLASKSPILEKKIKFFLFRAVSYFSFLIFPVWQQKTGSLSLLSQVAVMILFNLFMVGQWFLLGKEIDHRFKIYFRVNSSIDRVVYRLFLGMSFFVVYFNLLSLFEPKWTYNIFWGTWVVLGIFYSWPTRGKIIEESITTSFGEFHYLDRFEKTVVFFTVILFIISLPQMPSLVDEEALKLYFDPGEKLSNIFWNFLSVNYIPFKKYLLINKIAWSMHFYLCGIGFYLLTFYALLRQFVSRRLSILGVFALLSTWSYSKILAGGFGEGLTTTFSLIWVWSMLWIGKSSTYRSGLLAGLVMLWGVILNQNYFWLGILHFGLTWFYFFKDKNTWFKQQYLRYGSIGVLFSLIVFFNVTDYYEASVPAGKLFFNSLVSIIERKAFYSLSVVGAIFALVALVGKTKVIQLQREKIVSLVVTVLPLAFFTIFIDEHLLKSFSLLWPIVLLSLFPLEALFQNIARLRSSRNLIFLIYILICLLDSHFEGRIKIFARLFDINPGFF